MLMLQSCTEVSAGRGAQPHTTEAIAGDRWGSESAAVEVGVEEKLDLIREGKKEPWGRAGS